MGIHTGASVVEERSQRPVRRLGLLVLAVVMGCMAAVSVAHVDWDDVATYREARNWPATDAYMMDVTLERRASPSVTGPVQSLVLSATYAYEVDGVRLEGNRVSLRDSSELHDRHLQSLYARLNFARLTGRPVPVVYDPALPDRAFIDISVDWGEVAERLVLAAALLMIAFAAIALARTPTTREAGSTSPVDR